MDTLRTARKQRGRPFRKGQSGNPGGRPKTAEGIRVLARRHTAGALATLIEIAKGGANESARVAAANALLDRAWGKPGPALPEPEGPMRFTFHINEPPPGFREFGEGAAAEAAPPPGDG
ncbi:MAG: DUF5681 domain-containing protein [Rhodospirillales bacterium]|nr:DUF5681 domain-containing protein [Rhodospirillales bacterium]